MRVQPDPVPPRHTFDDEESTDEDGDEDPSAHQLQVSAYQDGEDQAVPKPKKMELGEAKATLTEEIQDCSAVVIGVEMLHDAETWFGESSQVGTFTTDLEESHENISIPIRYHSEDDIYTLSIPQQPPLQVADALARTILDTLHPANLVILTSSKSVSHTCPVALLRTSHPLKAVGGLPADVNPLFSNRGRVTRETLQARRAATDPGHIREFEVPLLEPPNMIQGIAASLMSLAEIHGIHATCFVVSAWIGDRLEDKDVERLVTKLNDALRGGRVNPHLVKKTWQQALGLSEAEKSSIYL